MAGRRLLDSSAVVALFRGDAGIEERLRSIDSAITLTVLGELLYGVKKSARSEENRSQLDAFVEDCEVLGHTRTTSELFAELKDGQRRLGLMIPDNDLWIAASAQEHGLVLAHRDKHYPQIPDLDHEVW